MDLFGKQYHPPGTTPGTLLPGVGGTSKLVLADYNEESYTEEIGLSPNECKPWIDNPNTTWIHIQGTPTSNTLEELSEVFNLHTLHLEDVLNTGQRPKLDVIEQHLFAILNLPTIQNENTVVEQLCIFLGTSFVISICTGEDNPFSLVYERLRNSRGKLRKREADYLFYTLIDTAVDHGFPVLEHYAGRLETIEESLAQQQNNVLLRDIHQARRELLLLRRKLAPHRELINDLLREDSSFIKDETRLYLRDCYDHNISIMEFVETYREVASDMLEVYLSSVSYRLNEIMRLLTIITTVFIPPTFLVGVYGMNFDRAAGRLNMPELYWPYGYVAVWVTIVSMICGMLFYFHRKHWF